jgi:hypothetical protein
MPQCPAESITRGVGLVATATAASYELRFLVGAFVAWRRFGSFVRRTIRR